MKLILSNFKLNKGPKNYSYELDTGYSHAVIKGISLGHVTAEKLNFQSISKMVHEKNKTKIEVEQLKFSRNTSKWQVKTSVVKKNYGFVFDKRVIQDNFSTLPYGF